MSKFVQHGRGRHRNSFTVIEKPSIIIPHIEPRFDRGARVFRYSREKVTRQERPTTANRRFHFDRLARLRCAVFVAIAGWIATAPRAFDSYMAAALSSSAWHFAE
jgi:hypothetical protein